MSRHKWKTLGTEKGPRGAIIWHRVCTRCGITATNQSFARAEAPFCYEQQRIDFAGPPPPKPPRKGHPASVLMRMPHDDEVGRDLHKILRWMRNPERWKRPAINLP